jgi:trigger factor
VEVPQALVEQDLRQMRQGAAGDSPVSDAEREQAERRVRMGLIFGEIVRKEGIKAEGKAVRARVEELAAEYEKPEEFVQWFYSDPSRLREIEGAVLEDLVVARLLESAQVSDETISFQELSNPGTA